MPKRGRPLPAKSEDKEEDFPRGQSQGGEAAVVSDAAEGRPGKRRKREEQSEDVSEFSGNVPSGVPSLRLENYQAGAKTIGEVVTVQKAKLVVALPSGLRGIVKKEEASDVFALQTSQQAEEGDNEDDSSASEGEGGDLGSAHPQNQTLSLSDIFRKGDRFRCLVLKQHSKEKKIDLSLRLSRIQGDLLMDAFYKGALLSATIKSAEDYGYVLSFGVRTVNGFLKCVHLILLSLSLGAGHPMARFTYGIPCKFSRTAEHFYVGAIIDVVVESFDKQQGVAIVAADKKRASKATMKEYDGLTIQQLLPGSLVSATIRRILKNGLLLSFLSYFHGAVELAHLKEDFPGPEWYNNYAEGEKVHARILFVDTKSKKIVLSLRRHMVQWYGEDPQYLPIGTVVNDAKVKRVDSNAGVLLDISNGKSVIAGYAHAPNVSDKQTRKLEKECSEGEKVRARVIGRKPIEGACSLSLKKSVVDQRFFSMGELAPGMKVSGTIEHVDGNGAFIKISDHVRGLCPLLHLSDTNSQKALRKLEPGKKVQTRVFECKPEHRKLILTRRKQLLRSELPVVASLDDAVPGTTTDGLVSGVQRYGCFVTLYNGLKGLAHANDLGLLPSQDPRSNFERGQCVRCSILSAKEGEKKLQLSLVGEPKNTASQATGESTTFSLGSFVRGKAVGFPQSGEIKVELEGGGIGIIQVAHLADHLETASALGDSIKPGQDLGRLMIVNMGNRQGQSVIYLTRKRLLIRAMEEKRLPQRLDDLEQWQTYPGYIVNITDFGCFVRFLGSLTGLASLSTMPNVVANHTDAFVVGQSVQAKVSNINHEKARFAVSLNIKGTQNDTLSSEWLFDFFNSRESLDNNDETRVWGKQCPIGSVKEVSIEEVKDYGILVDMPASGDLIGFVMHHQVDSKDVSVGSKWEGMVLDLNKRDGIADLSLRESLTKARSPTSIARELDVDNEVEAEVELVKAEYTVVTLPNTNRQVGFLPTFNFNLQRVDIKQVQFEAGTRLRARVHSLPNAENGYRLILKTVSRQGGKASAKKKKDASEMIGHVVSGKVLSIGQLEMHVSSAYGRGRVHAANVDAEHGSAPLDRFSVGERIKVVVMGKTDRNYLELSAKDNEIAQAERSNGLHLWRPEFDSLVVGDKVAAVCCERKNSGLWACVTPSLKGRIDKLEASDDIDDLNDFENRFFVGQYLQCRVVGLDSVKQHLDLSCRREKPGPSALKANSLVPARVLRTLPGQGVQVKTVANKQGYIHITELSDRFVDFPLERIKVGLIFQCCVLDPEAEPAQLSTRESLGGRGFPRSHEEGSDHDAIQSISALKVGQRVQCYVKQTTSKGCFVTLGRKLDGRIQLANLSVTFLEHPQKEFPPGKLLKAKVVHFDIYNERVELSLKKVETQTVKETGLKEGEIVNGSVKRVEENYLLISIDGTDVSGLCHKKDFSDERVKDLEAMIKPNTPVKARVLKVESESGRVLLGMKRSLLENKEYNTAEATKEDILFMEDEAEDGEDESEDVLETGTRDYDQFAKNEREGSQAVKRKVSEQGLHSLFEGVGKNWEAQDEIEGRNQDSANAKTEHAKKHTAEKKKQSSRDDEELEELAFQRERKRAREQQKPGTSDDFEKLLLASPNSSYLWIRYMAHKVSLGEQEEARQVIERALETINLNEEHERENVWTAYMNFEHEYSFEGDEGLRKVFNRACERANPKRMHLALIGIYERAGEHDKAEATLKQGCKKFGYSAKVWLRYVEHLLIRGDGQRVQEVTTVLDSHKQKGALQFDHTMEDGFCTQILNRAFQALPKRKHVKAIFRSALLEYRIGSPERARSMFESLLRNYPQRTDIFSAYVDQEVKLGELERARGLLERGTALKLAPKKMKFIFKKYLDFEKRHGTDERVENVKSKAMEFVESNL